MQGPTHRSRVPAEPLAASPSHLAQRPLLQSVFLHGQAQRVPQAEGGETRPGPHQAPASLPAVMQHCLGALYKQQKKELFHLIVSHIALLWQAGENPEDCDAS